MSNRSFIKWVGGKTRSLSQILTKFPKDFNTYYEPFLGSGVVYFNLLPHDAVLGDIEENLATAHRAVKNHPQDVCNYLKLLENDEVVYYDVRNDFNHNPETVVRLHPRLSYFLKETTFSKAAHRWSKKY